MVPPLTGRMFAHSYWCGCNDGSAVDWLVGWLASGFCVGVGGWMGVCGGLVCVCVCVFRAIDLRV